MSSLIGNVFSRTKNIDSLILLFLTGLLLTPFFFVTHGDGIVFAPLLAFDEGVSRGGFGIHISVFGILAIGIVFVVRLAKKQINFRQIPVILSLAIILWMTIAATYGLGIPFGLKDRYILTLALYIQTVLPIGLFVALLTLPFSRDTMKTVVLAIPVIGTGTIILLLVVSSYFLSIYSSLNAYRYLAEAFYGSKNIQPILVLAGLTIILWQFSLVKRDFSLVSLWGMFVLHAMYVFTIWSRSGILAIGILFGLWLLSEVIRKKWDLRFVIDRFILTVIMATMAIASLTVGGLSVRPILQGFVEQIQEENDGLNLESQQLRAPVERARVIARSLEFGTQRRKLLFMGGVERVMSSPLVGDAFVTMSPGTILYGRAVESHKIYPSHNQYVDIAVRSGLPALILYLSLLFSIAAILWKAFRNNSDLALFATFFLIAVMAGTMFQAYFVVTQTATMIFLLLAMAIRLSKPPEGRSAQ